MRLISFPRSAKSNPLGGYFLRDEILSCVPSGYCIIFREMPILLLDNSYWNDSVRKKLLGRLSNPDSRIAVSNIITEIFDLPTAFEQVNAVHRLCGQNAASAGSTVLSFPSLSRLISSVAAIFSMRLNSCTGTRIRSTTACRRSSLFSVWIWQMNRYASHCRHLTGFAV